MVLYEFEKVDTKVIRALDRLKSKGIPVMYYEKGEITRLYKKQKATKR